MKVILSGPTSSLFQERVVSTKFYIYLFLFIRLLTDFVCLYNYEFGLSLCKIVGSSVILLLPLFIIYLVKYTINWLTGMTRKIVYMLQAIS
jgi:hypothetical protein